MILTAVVVAVASVMVASLGVATSGFTLVLITPVLVIVGLVFMFHQRFTFVEGLTFVLALIGALSTASWFLWFPIGNAFLVQYTIFHKPASPSYYDPAFAPVNASELILAMDVGISGDRFVALVGAKGIGKSTEMEFICSTLSRAIHVPWTDESQKTIPEILSTKLWGDASVFLKIVNVVWGRSVLCIDVKHKSRTIDIGNFRANVKHHVSDEKNVHVLIVASDGLMFNALALEPRMTTFVAKEMSVSKAERYVRKFTSTTLDLTAYPRTLSALKELLGKEDKGAFIQYKLDQAVASIIPVFQECTSAWRMFNVSIHEKTITYADVERFCLNKYPTQDAFEERLVRQNVFVPVLPNVYELQYDQTREAMRRIIANMTEPKPAGETLGVSDKAPPVVWVQLVDSPESAMKPSNATAFMVSPTANDIDGLKKAVKSEKPNALKDVDADTLKVYARIAEGVWAEVPRASTPLTANTEDSAYHVVVQKP